MSTIDDRDPGIEYSGTWSQGGVPFEYRNTTTYTTTAGSSSIYNFTGTSISVYGTITHISEGVAPVSNYTIDSGLPQQFTGTQQAEDQHQQMFFRASNLELTQHTLVITNMVDSDFLYLDYFEVGTASPTPTTSTQSQSKSSPTTDAATVTVTSYVNEKQSGPPIGAAVGGAIAGFAIIFLIFYVCFLFCRRRRGDLHRGDAPHPEKPSARRQCRSNITPFIIEESEGGVAQSGSGDGAMYHTAQGYNDNPGSSPGMRVKASSKLPFSAGARRKGQDFPPGHGVSSNTG